MWFLPHCNNLTFWHFHHENEMENYCILLDINHNHSDNLQTYQKFVFGSSLLPYNIAYFFSFSGKRPSTFPNSYLCHLRFCCHKLPKTAFEPLRNVQLWRYNCLWWSIRSASLVYLFYGRKSPFTRFELHHELHCILLFQ